MAACITILVCRGGRHDSVFDRGFVQLSRTIEKSPRRRDNFLSPSSVFEVTSDFVGDKIN